MLPPAAWGQFVEYFPCLTGNLSNRTTHAVGGESRPQMSEISLLRALCATVCTTKTRRFARFYRISRNGAGIGQTRWRSGRDSNHPISPLNYIYKLKERRFAPNTDPKRSRCRRLLTLPRLCITLSLDQRQATRSQPRTT
jgi:hypothetical protein